MAERLVYLRSIREGSLQANAQAPLPPRQVVKQCAILLQSNPRRSKFDSTQSRDASGEPDEMDLVSSPADQRPETASNDSHRSLDTGEPRTSLESGTTDAEEPSPEMFKNPWSDCDDARREKVDFLRERCPSRSSSFLDDVASLVSGLSIRSSLSRSSSGSSQRSMRSVSSRAELSGSGSRDERNGARCPVAVLMADSHTWSTDRRTPAHVGVLSYPPSAPRSHKTQDQYSPGSTSYTLENQELVRFCCSKTFWCIHQRISAVRTHGSPAEAFTCTAVEVNSRDGLGNTALHVAARWGAPGLVLLRILEVATHPDAANHRGETFLHVLDPVSLAPGELASITQCLASRGFNFAQLDNTGSSFLARLTSRPGSPFTLDALQAVLSPVPGPDAMSPLHHSHSSPVSIAPLTEPSRTSLLLHQYPAPDHHSSPQSAAPTTEHSSNNSPNRPPAGANIRRSIWRGWWG